MARINNYALSELKVTDKILASDGDTGATKNVSPEDIAELNGGAKIYRAFITQNGTSNPIAVVVGPNTIGDIVWTRSGVGVYSGYLDNAFIGNVGLVVGATTDTKSVKLANLSSDILSISSYLYTSLTDGILSNQYIEIRIYES